MKNYPKMVDGDTRFKPTPTTRPVCQTTAYDTEAPSLYNASDTMNFASKCCTAGNLDIKLGTCPIDIDLYLLQVNRVPVTVTALPRPKHTLSNRSTLCRDC